MPVFDTRAIGEFPIGNFPLRDHHAALDGGCSLHPEAWIDPLDLKALIDQGDGSLVDAAGTPLAWISGNPEAGPKLEAGNSFVIVHPWDLLRANERHVSLLSGSRVPEDLSPLVSIDGCVRIGEGTKLLPGVVIEGNVVIGAGCKIGPNCYLRGNTSIGDHCHVGNAVEIKNSILLSHTNVGHLSYVGDSVLGEKVNFGAGTMTSNLRHDGRNHRSLVGETLVDTGRRKFGCIVGDGVHTGINTSIYPGRKLFAGTSTLPGEIVRRDVHP